MAHLYYCADHLQYQQPAVAEKESTFAMRIVPVLFGIGIVYLTSGLRSRLGNVERCLQLVYSRLPGMVYFSRDFIHEIPLVFFTLWLVVCSTHFTTRSSLKNYFSLRSHWH
jgi:predicted membrane-bound mannosyltransferase